MDPNFVSEYFAYIVPGTMQSTSFGQLGAFGNGNLHSNLIGFSYVGFFNSGGDEIDLTEVGGGSSSPPDAAPAFPNSLLFQCQTNTCFQEFLAGRTSGPLFGTAEATVVPVPEPAQPMIGITGITILFAFALRFKTDGLRYVRTSRNESPHSCSFSRFRIPPPCAR